MSKQSEQILEEKLIAQLQKLGYANFPIADEKALIANLKSQLEKHNQISFSDAEFNKVLNLQGNTAINTLTIL
jgi:type I restriction enzyme R subunit